MRLYRRCRGIIIITTTALRSCSTSSIKRRKNRRYGTYNTIPTTTLHTSSLLKSLFHNMDCQIRAVRYIWSWFSRHGTSMIEYSKTKIIARYLSGKLKHKTFKSSLTYQSIPMIIWFTFKTNTVIMLKYCKTILHSCITFMALMPSATTMQDLKSWTHAKCSSNLIIQLYLLGWYLTIKKWRICRRRRTLHIWKKGPKSIQFSFWVTTHTTSKKVMCMKKKKIAWAFRVLM